MATELGVDEVALMLTDRTVPRWDRRRERSRVDRLTRIASEAAAQCERNDVPVIHGPQPCAAWLDAMPGNAAGVLFGARAQGALTFDGTPEQVWCAVGPEGGFTDAEIASFEGAGFAVASLGTWVLRVETAVPAALTIVRDRLEPL
jgi:16S rRNA (uracil1498-N3)-methyltransferase